MHKTVLIVDDSRMSRITISTIIKAHHADWTIIDAAHGEEALKKIAGRQIHLIIIDMNTPDTDAIALGNQLRQKYSAADIVLISANIEQAQQQQALATGFAFIARPITEDKLMAYINSTDSPDS